MPLAPDRFCARSNRPDPRGRNYGLLGEVADNLIQIPADEIKKFVHQLGLLHFRDIDNDLLSGTCHPPGFGEGATSTRQDQQASVRPGQCLDIVGKLLLCFRAFQVLSILGDTPVHIIGIHIRPMESARALRRVAEVINLVTSCPESVNDLSAILVSSRLLRISLP